MLTLSSPLFDLPDFDVKGRIDPENGSSKVVILCDFCPPAFAPVTQRVRFGGLEVV